MWYGIGQNIFGTDEDRQFLTDYTKKAVLFAESMGIKNLGFSAARKTEMFHREQIPILPLNFLNK